MVSKNLTHGKINQQEQLNLFLLKTIIKSLQCIQKVIRQINDEVNEVIEERFKSIQNRYQNNLEKLTKGSDFAFDYDYVHLLYYKFQKINPNCGGSNIDSPDWIKKATINRKNKKV